MLTSHTLHIVAFAVYDVIRHTSLLLCTGKVKNNRAAINSKHSCVYFNVLAADKVSVQSVWKIYIDKRGFTGHGEDTDVSTTAFGVGRYEHVTGKCLNFIGAVCENGAFFDLI